MIRHTLIFAFLFFSIVTVAQETSSENKTISFNYLIPKKYKIRIIYDTNNNGKWDTGNYLEKKQPEPVQYFPEVQEIRPNWVLNEVIKITPNK